MDWNCTITEERLSDAIDGALLADEAAAFAAHRSACERCARLVAQVGGLIGRVRELPSIAEPPFLASRIIAVTRGTPEAQRAKGWSAWSPTMWLPRFAMGLVTVALTFLVVFHATTTGPHRLDLSPMSLYHAVDRKAHLTYAHGVKFVNDMRVVYEIQSRLSSVPQQPALEPTPTPEPQPSNPNSAPKTQKTPSESKGQNATEFASLIVPEGYSSQPATPRSLE